MLLGRFGKVVFICGRLGIFVVEEVSRVRKLSGEGNDVDGSVETEGNSLSINSTCLE